jgi:ABC-type dipeptide/oligopeptide/nickel transport system permease subunit
MMTLIILLMGSNFLDLLIGPLFNGLDGRGRLTRSQFYRYKGREYVLASRTLGASDARLIFKHILPNGIGTIVTSTAFMIPGVIFSEATISYLLPGALSFKGGTSFGVTLARAQGEHSDPSLFDYLRLDRDDADHDFLQLVRQRLTRCLQSFAERIEND